MLLSRIWYYLTSIPTLLWGIKNWPSVIYSLLLDPGQRIVSLRNGCLFRFRTLMDLWIIKETCLDRQYERASTRLEDGWTLLDIGAGLGDWCICVAARCPRAVIYAYEPFPESFTLLEENLALNRIRNVKAFPYAVSSREGFIDLHTASKNAVQHSTALKSDTPGTRVQSFTLDQVLGEITQCDYLKMDCEGAEYDILFGANDLTLQKIKRICLEYHDGVTEFSHQDLILFLENKGFQIRLTPNPAWQHLGFLYAVKNN
jgi:FkbM family methyltransferase